MPNTLAHVGFQGLITRSVSHGSDIKWIGLGSVLPDIPWIMQHLVRLAGPSVDTDVLRLCWTVPGPRTATLFEPCTIAPVVPAVISRSIEAVMSPAVEAVGFKPSPARF